MPPCGKILQHTQVNRHARTVKTSASQGLENSTAVIITWKIQPVLPKSHRKAQRNQLAC